MSTTFKDMIDAIYNRIKINWTTPPIIHWPGSKFVPPSDGTTAWIRPRVIFVDAEQVTLGQTGQNRILGSLTVNIFTPIGAGADEAAQHADTMRDLFPRGLRLAAGTNFLIFQTPGVVPEIEDEIWYQLPMEAPFYLDEEP